MLKNLVKISLRLITRNRAYSLINFFGLSFGLFVFILIYLYVSYELSYDRHNEKYETIYRVYKEGENEYQGSKKFAVVQAPLADVIKEQLPEVNNISRILNYDNLLIQIGSESFFENQYNATDPDIFQIFTFEIVAGNSKRVLQNPRAVVLNETLAKKYFGSVENAIGKTLHAETWTDLGDFVVESVIRDMPSNSHFRMKIIFPFETIVKILQPDDLVTWGNSNYLMYLTLNQDANLGAIETKLQAAIKPHLEAAPAYKLQSLKGLYLSPPINFSLGQTANMNRIYIFSCIGILVLFIACINYTNMATARASNRTKEIGLRKVVGARRIELIVQFIGEAIFMTAVSTIVACMAVVIVLSYFNSFLEKEIVFSLQLQPVLIAMLAGLALLVGTVAGIYPALILSSYNPVVTLKGVAKREGNFFFRDALMVFQFIISGALIFSTIVVWMQMNYVDKKDLGFNRDQIVVLYMRDKALREKADVLKQKLIEHPDIISVTASSRPLSLVSSHQGRTWQVKGEERPLSSYYCEVDSSFLGLHEIKLLSGRNLTSADDGNAAVVNESMVKELGYTNEEIVDVTFAHGDSTHVIGVVKDFHFQDFRQQIQPLRLKNFQGFSPGFLSIKINQSEVQSTLKYAEETFAGVSTKYPFEYKFYDEIYFRAYMNEIKTAKFMGWSAGAAILVAALGLYGLVLFMLNQRVKEIGIRKVLGASSLSILGLLSSRFVALVLIGYVMACILANYGIQKWLNEFAYKVSVGFGIFSLTLFIMMMITGFTIFIRVRKVTSINPAEVLKHE